MKKVMGYKLNLLPVEKIQVPLGARLLTVLDSNGEATIFAVIDQDETRMETRTIHAIATGAIKFSGVPENVCHLGSFLLANYGIVYHFFADKEEAKATEVPEHALSVKELEVDNER